LRLRTTRQGETMNGPLAMILVIFVIVIGIGSAWAITAQSAAQPPMQDSAGHTQNSSVINATAATSSIAISTMPILNMAFIIAVCVILVIVLVWFWRNGQYKQKKY